MKKKEITKDFLLWNGRHLHKNLIAAIEVLKREIELCQPNLIIALGQVPLLILTNEFGVYNFRGSMLLCTLPLALDYQPKVIPTLSPAQVFKHFAMRNIVLQDFRRIGKEYQTKEYDIPDYNLIVRPDYATTTQILVETLHLLHQAESSNTTLELAFDIETRVGHISDIGFAWSSTSAICIPLMSASKPEGYWTFEQEAQIIHLLLCIFSSPALRILGQNFSYDAQYILS